MKDPFLKEFTKNPKRIGAIAQSSRFLVSDMVKNIDTKNARKIAELGAGTGNITRGILDSMNPEAQLIAFEIHPPFVEELRHINDSRLIIEEKNAEIIPASTFDCIVSSLPLAGWKKEEREKMLNCIHRALVEHGTFIQFSYARSYENFLKEKFTSVSVTFSLLNIPPAFVFVCKK
jgi:phospholipid N-methyltransferase